MRDRLDDLGDRTDVALITFTSRANLAEYEDTHDLGFPVLMDPDRSGYAAYGLGRGSLRRMYSWPVLRTYAEILRQDGFSQLKRTTEDTRQLGGDFVVGPDGLLRYGFWGEGPDQRPSVDELIDALQSNS